MANLAHGDTCSWHHLRVLIRGGLGLGIILTGLWVYCLIDAIMADEGRIRNLTKAMWIAIILFTFEVGAVAWLVAGRPQGPQRSLPYKGNRGHASASYPEYDRPGRFAATNPEDDEAFLRQVRQRAEEQMREAKRQRAEREQAERDLAERERAKREGREGRPVEDSGPEPPV
jgi:hypothetical protein